MRIEVFFSANIEMLELKNPTLETTCRDRVNHTIRVLQDQICKLLKNQSTLCKGNSVTIMTCAPEHCVSVEWKGWDE